MHQGNGFILAETGGVEQVTLTTNQIPVHSHPFLVTVNVGGGNAPANTVLAQSTTIKLYSTVSPGVALGASSVTPVGGSQPHNNFQPYLCVDFIISLFGIFPSQT
jgi:microcystin-dependent protein